MTSVSNQQYAPRYGYEMPPKPAPAQSEGHVDTHAGDAPSDSTSPRSPVGPEQRGRFSRHNQIVNQQPQGADAKGEIAELSQKNQNLLAKYHALFAKFKAKITELNTKIESLTAQLSASANTTEEMPKAPDAKTQNRRTDDQSVETQTPSTADTQPPKTLGTEQSQPQGGDQLAADLTQLQTAFSQLLEGFNAAIKALTEKLDKLAQLLKGVTQNQATSAPSDTAEATPSPNEKPAQGDESKAPARGTVDYLKQENQKLEAQIDQMEAHFEQAMTTLEQQFESLTQQVREQK